MDVLRPLRHNFSRTRQKIKNPSRTFANRVVLYRINLSCVCNSDSSSRANRSKMCVQSKLETAGGTQARLGSEIILAKNRPIMIDCKAKGVGTPHCAVLACNYKTATVDKTVDLGSPRSDIPILQPLGRLIQAQP